MVTIIFPKFIDYIEKLPQHSDLIGVGKNNSITGNAILVAPSAKSITCKKIMDDKKK
jgi:hypothetical protein